MPAGFDEYSQDYARLLRDPIRDRFGGGSHFFHQRKWELLEAWARRRSLELTAQTWLDIGCGQGELLRLGRPHVGRAVGCDLSEGMLDACADLDVRHQAAPDRLPFEDGSVDLATAVCVYHHLPLAGRPALTAEVHRVLKPGGLFFIIEHNPFNPVTRRIVRRTPVDDGAILLTAGTSRKLLRAAGLEVQGTRYFLYFPAGLYRQLGFLERGLAVVPLGGQYATLGWKPLASAVKTAAMSEQ